MNEREQKSLDKNKAQWHRLKEMYAETLDLGDEQYQFAAMFYMHVKAEHLRRQADKALPELTKLLEASGKGQNTDRTFYQHIIDHAKSEMGIASLMLMLMKVISEKAPHDKD